MTLTLPFCLLAISLSDSLLLTVTISLSSYFLLSDCRTVLLYILGPRTAGQLSAVSKSVVGQQPVGLQLSWSVGQQVSKSVVIGQQVSSQQLVSRSVGRTAGPQHTFRIDNITWKCRKTANIIEKNSVYNTVNGDLHCFTHRKQQK